MIRNSSSRYCNCMCWISRGLEEPIDGETGKLLWCEKQWWAVTACNHIIISISLRNWSLSGTVNTKHPWQPEWLTCQIEVFASTHRFINMSIEFAGSRHQRWLIPDMFVTCHMWYIPKCLYVVLASYLFCLSLVASGEFDGCSGAAAYKVHRYMKIHKQRVCVLYHFSTRRWLIQLEYMYFLVKHQVPLMLRPQHYGY